jgi:hypothetical protein
MVAGSRQQLEQCQDANRQTIDSGKSTVRNIEQILDMMGNMAFKITTQLIELDQTLGLTSKKSMKTLSTWIDHSKQ